MSLYLDVLRGTSTAQRVILEAGCPVTAVKPDVGSRT